jgi:hypothetical protein
MEGWETRYGFARPSDVSDEEWAFVLPYLLLSREDSAHREHDLRFVCNGVRFCRLARDYERLDTTLKGFHRLCVVMPHDRKYLQTTQLNFITGSS